MIGLTRRVLPLLALAIVLVVVPYLSGPSPATGNPYLSALSDVAATPALAAPGGCGNRACDVTQFRTCIANPGTHCVKNVRTAAGCATVGC